MNMIIKKDTCMGMKIVDCLSGEDIYWMCSDCKFTKSILEQIIYTRLQIDSDCV